MPAGKRQQADRGETGGEPFRITDWPMHYFAAIQRQNFANMSRALSPVDITPYEWRVLAILGEQDGRTINEIAAMSVIERSKISRAITRMARDGLVERNLGSRDRRKAAIRLTAAGRQKLADALPVAQGVYGRNLAGLSEEETAQLMGLLRRIKDNVFRLEAFA